MSFSYTSVPVFYRRVVFILCSTELQSISPANYDQRTGTGLFPAHKHNYTNSAFEQMSHVCVYLRSEGQVKVSKVYDSLTKVEWEGSRKQTERGGKRKTGINKRKSASVCFLSRPGPIIPMEIHTAGPV